MHRVAQENRIVGTEPSKRLSRKPYRSRVMPSGYRLFILADLAAGFAGGRSRAAVPASAADGPPAREEDLRPLHGLLPRGGGGHGPPPGQRRPQGPPRRHRAVRCHRRPLAQLAAGARRHEAHAGRVGRPGDPPRDPRRHRRLRHRRLGRGRGGEGRSSTRCSKSAEDKDYPFEVTICLDAGIQGNAGLAASIKYLLEKHGDNPKLARRDGKPLIFGYMSSFIGFRHGADDPEAAPRVRHTPNTDDLFTDPSCD